MVGIYYWVYHSVGLSTNQPTFFGGRRVFKIGYDSSGCFEMIYPLVN